MLKGVMDEGLAVRRAEAESQKSVHWRKYFTLQVLEEFRGRVAFNSEGDRIAWTQIEQMWDGNYTKVGYYDFSSDNLTWFGIERWPGGKIPQDRTIVKPVLRVVSQALFIAICMMASIGILAGFGLLVFNLKHQHRRYIKLSQPQINNILLLGCVICLGCIYLEGLDGRYIDEESFAILCQTRAWVLSLGFTLSYGSLFSKVWTLYRLTIRRKKEIKVFLEWEMYLVIAIFLLVDIVVLTVWQIIDPLKRELESFPHETSADTEKDIEIKPQLEHCSSQYFNVWLGVVFGYKGVLLLFGILLAYETRSCKIKQVNDSRFVGMSIYNVVVLCIITAPVTLIIGSHQDASFAFVAVAILLSSTLTMGLIFVPKILEVMRNPRDGMESAALTESNASREEEERFHRLNTENEDLKKQIAEKEDKIKDLNHKLTIKAAQQRVKGSSTVENRPNDLPCSLANNIANNHPPGGSTCDKEVNVGTLVNISSAVPARTLKEGDSPVAADPNSDSALPTSSTAKSSKTSASEENYSESYC